MTGLDHETSEIVAVAANWYRENRNSVERPIIPNLRQRFNLTTKEACEALFEANAAGGANAS